MIELGRASGDFKRFKEILKDVTIQKSEENVEIKFIIEKNRHRKQEFINLLRNIEKFMKGDFTLTSPEISNE